MNLVLESYAVLAGLAILQSAVMLLHTYANARFFRRRIERQTDAGFQPLVELFVPCKGVAPGFDLLVALLLEQDYPSYRVTFIVESVDDPAWRRLQEILGQRPAGFMRIVTAGRARDCGQKVHNLLVGTAGLESGVDVVAFLDGDVRLTREWLSRLVDPLKKPGIGAVTGYRWFIPEGKDWPSAVLAALNASVALVLGNHRWNAIWGGSWGLRRSAFDRAEVREAWRGSVSDDYSAWRAVRKAGLRVLFEPGCLLASPVRCTWSDLLEFARRQYLITRVYAPGFWWLALSGEVLFNVAFWGGVPLAFWSRSFGIGCVVMILYALAMLRASIRQSIAAFTFPAWREALVRSRRLDIWGQPLLGLFNLALMLASASGRRITWRGIRYRLDGPQRTEILGYVPPQ